MKKTGFVWFMIILTIIGTLLGILSTIAEYTGSTPISYTGDPTLGIIGIILNVITFIISIVYVVKLYKMTPDSIKWTNITFISYIIVLLFSIIGIAINTGDISTGIISNLPVLVIEVALWVLFYKHLRKIMVRPV